MFLYVPATTVSAPNTVHKIIVTNLPDIHTFLFNGAREAGVDPMLVSRIIKCESNWKNVQSNLRNKYDPMGREASYGIAQIHITAHKEITKEYALNKYFSVSYLIKEIANGHGGQWTCYRKVMHL